MSFAVFLAGAGRGFPPRSARGCGCNAGRSKRSSRASRGGWDPPGWRIPGPARRGRLPSWGPSCRGPARGRPPVGVGRFPARRPTGFGGAWAPGSWRSDAPASALLVAADPLQGAGRLRVRRRPAGSDREVDLAVLVNVHRLNADIVAFGLVPNEVRPLPVGVVIPDDGVLREPHDVGLAVVVHVGDGERVADVADVGVDLLGLEVRELGRRGSAVPNVSSTISQGVSRMGFGSRRGSSNRPATSFVIRPGAARFKRPHPSERSRLLRASGGRERPEFF